MVHYDNGNVHGTIGWVRYAAFKQHYRPASREFLGVILPSVLEVLVSSRMHDEPHALLKNSARQRDRYAVLETALYSPTLRTVDNVYNIYTNSKGTLARHCVSALSQSTTQIRD